MHLYVLPAVRAVFSDPLTTLYWTEGEKKAAKATQEGLPCLGLGGLWNWVDRGTANGIAELDAIVHVCREEFILPDSDVWTRPDLLRAVFALGKELEARGARVSVVRAEKSASAGGGCPQPWSGQTAADASSSTIRPVSRRPCASRTGGRAR